MMIERSLIKDRIIFFEKELSDMKEKLEDPHIGVPKRVLQIHAQHCTSCITTLKWVLSMEEYE